MKLKELQSQQEKKHLQGTSPFVIFHNIIVFPRTNPSLLNNKFLQPCCCKWHFQRGIEWYRIRRFLSKKWSIHRTKFRWSIKQLQTTFEKETERICMRRKDTWWCLWLGTKSHRKERRRSSENSSNPWKECLLQSPWWTSDEENSKFHVSCGERGRRHRHQPRRWWRQLLHNWQRISRCIYQWVEWNHW